MAGISAIGANKLPVVHELSSDNKKATDFAILSVFPTRPIGWILSSDLYTSSGASPVLATNCLTAR